MLVICAHPDDESFGLGAERPGVTSRVLCFTHGEAPTLSEIVRSLGEVRVGELSAAAVVLGVEEVTVSVFMEVHPSIQFAEH